MEKRQGSSSKVPEPFGRPLLATSLPFQPRVVDFVSEIESRKLTLLLYAPLRPPREEFLPFVSDLFKYVLSADLRFSTLFYVRIAIGFRAIAFLTC